MRLGPAGGRPLAGPIATLLLVTGAAIAGWLGGSWAHSAGPLALTGHLTGRVSLVSETGGKVCVTPTEGSADRCAGLSQRPDHAPPRVGDAISVSTGLLRTSSSESIEVFILEPATDAE